MASKEADVDTRKQTASVIDGVTYILGTTREYLKDIKNLPVKGDEVFVATYPRSGTTWVSEIVWQIFVDGSLDKRPIQQRVPYVDSLKPFGEVKSSEELVEFFSAKPSPRVFKTHLQYPLVPMGDGVTTPKYINVIRNPKDCAVSYYLLWKRLVGNDSDQPWEEFFNTFMQGDAMYGHWFDHVLGWWAHRDDPNILILKYEDMKKDSPSAVKQIAKFIGKDLSEETIQLIAKQTSFEAMSTGDGRFFDGDEEHGLLKRYEVNNQWIRKGKTGDWKNYFTEEQIQRFDEMYEKKMAGSGLELEFE